MIVRLVSQWKCSGFVFGWQDEQEDFVFYVDFVCAQIIL